MRDAHSQGARVHPFLFFFHPPPILRRGCTASPKLTYTHYQLRTLPARLLVLIFPATNYHPTGYELVHRDEHMCRGAVFYAPGSASSNMINAHHVSPTLLVYRRESEERACSEDVSVCIQGRHCADARVTPHRPRRRLAPVAGPRCFHCLHVQKELKLQRQAVKERYMGNAVAKKRAAR